jgi:hypothetical protein
MKPAYFGGDAQHSGIDVTFVRSRGKLYISGWYDSFVGIEGEELSLSEFFKRVGITLKDCEKAFREAKE